MCRFYLSVLSFVLSLAVLIASVESRCDECKFWSVKKCDNDVTCNIYQRRSGFKVEIKTIPSCIYGNVDIINAETLKRVQNAKVIYGSVMVQGQMMIDSKRMDVLDLGGIEWISGFLYIHGNPYLKHVYADNLKHASFVSIINNPMLNPCDAWDIGNETECKAGVSCIASDRFDEWLNSGECPDEAK